MGKRYIKDDVVLIRSISKHCHVWGKKEIMKKSIKAVLVPDLLLGIKGCRATGTVYFIHL